MRISDWSSDVCSSDLPDMPLLWAVRDEIGLTGSKFGCGMALCGACTMHVDGDPIRSCQTALSDVAGKKVTTIEGLGGKVAKAVEAAWIKHEVAQCGYCQSGQIIDRKSTRLNSSH